jgi:hypothetical protein
MAIDETASWCNDTEPEKVFYEIDFQYSTKNEKAILVTYFCTMEQQHGT